MKRRDAEDIQAIVEEALKEAQALPDGERFLMGAINWADLKCTDIEERRSLIYPEREPLIAVLIEEVSPDATNLHKFIGERLDAAGWTNIYVTTEW